MAWPDYNVPPAEKCSGDRNERMDPQADHNLDSPRPRPFVGVMMKCCRTYVRAYLNPAGEAFVGWCPRCAAQVRIEAVAEGGSTNRFFEAS